MRSASSRISAWFTTQLRGKMSRILCLVTLSGFLSVGVVADPVPPQSSTRPATNPSVQPMWVNHVEPILSKSCVKCHGGSKQKGGLDLRQPQSIFDGGTDGSVVIPGRPGDSPLYQRIQPGAKDHMPPDAEQQLSAEEVSLLQQWIATLPTAVNHPPITASGVDWNQSAPSLMDLATRSRWHPPSGLQASDAIDHLIKARWQEQHVSGSAVCDDRTFVRRIYLDLVGRIPTRVESETFIGSTEPQKRATLVDRLLADGQYARHMAEVFDVVLMERKGNDAEGERKAHGWNEYLRGSFATNRPWNEMVADIVAGRPKSPGQKGAEWFLYERKNNYQQMAEAVAPVAFGVSIACAQCHNHPMAHEIKQQNYWGLVAAFNRTTNADTSDGAALSESAIGGFVSFTNLKKESQPAILALLNDQTIAEQRPAEGVKEQDTEDKYIVPPSKEKGRVKKAAIPKFSRRAAVAEAVSHGNPLLARAFVNRMWAMLLGRGFVNPVDQMDSRHLPSHPELLAWLSRDFEKSGYDIKHLIRTIVLSQTYQLDSRWRDSTAPAPELFARGLDKPLSAEVLCRSLLVATGHEASNGGDKVDADALRHGLIGAFPSLLEVEYNATLQQAMFLTNNPKFDELLKPVGEDLTVKMLKLQTNQDRAREVFVEILGRLPDEAEHARSLAYLEARSERPEAGLRQLEWALLTCSEFLLNH